MPRHKPSATIAPTTTNCQTGRRPRAVTVLAFGLVGYFGYHMIDGDRGWLAWQRLQVELVNALGRHKAHGGALHCLGHGFGVAEVVLLALKEGLDELCRHQLHVVAECKELAAQMVGADAGPHADQARRHVCKPSRDLAAG